VDGEEGRDTRGSELDAITVRELRDGIKFLGFAQEGHQNRVCLRAVCYYSASQESVGGSSTARRISPR
jgi:hypothetical protein